MQRCLLDVFKSYHLVKLFMLTRLRDVFNTFLRRTASTAQKNIFSFPKCSEKMVFPKNRTGIWSFLCYQERWYFLLPKISSFSLEKWSFSKKDMETWHFPQMFWKDGLSKKIRLEYDLSYCIIWKDNIIFFPKIWSYSLDRKWKMIFLKKIHGNMIFFSNAPKRWSFQK